MKTYNNLFDKICDFDNLYLASRKAEKGKRFRHEVAVFNIDRMENLLEIQKLLQAGTYPFGRFRTFGILHPKPRTISAAPYRDRVVHHAIINVIGPLFERKFIYDSYANQVGKGSSAALDRCTQFARRYRYVLQLDIRKYFPSIDHEILFREISRTIGCSKTLALIKQVIDNSNPQEAACFYFPGDQLFTPFERKKGLPIGNLTSQFFANVYLNPMDHFLKECLCVPGYIRYVDDFLLFGNDKAFLHDCKTACQQFLNKYRLRQNPKKGRVFPVITGIPFLGFRVYPNHRRLLDYGVKRARHRLRGLVQGHRNGVLSKNQIKQSLQAWFGHINQGDTWGLRKALFRQYLLESAMCDAH